MSLPDDAILADAPNVEGTDNAVVDALAKEMDDFSKYDKRSSIYASLDAANKSEEEVTTPDDTPSDASASEPVEDGDTPAPSSEDAPPVAPEAPVEDEEMSLDELLAKMGSKKVRGKFAGEEGTLTVADIVKNAGINKATTAKAQAVAELHKQLNQLTSTGSVGNPDFQTEKRLALMDEREVQSKYDELHYESPYRAGVFLETVKADKSRFAQETAQKTVEIGRKYVKTIAPEITDGDWERMNSDDFISKYEDIRLAQETGNIPLILTTALLHYREEMQSGAIASVKATAQSEKDADRARLEAKKKGATIRTTNTPKVEPKAPVKFVEQSAKDVIRERQERARERMGIPKGF